MNLATYISLAAFLVGLVLAAVTLLIAAAPNTRGLRFFSLTCFWGAFYALSNATLATRDLWPWGIRVGLLFIGLHTATWFVYIARREDRKLFAYERVVVAVAIAWALLTLVPNVLYHSDEPWIHDVPALGIRYVDARSTALGNVAFAFFGAATVLLIGRCLRRVRSASSTERAELLGLGALLLCGINDSLVTADVLHGPYLLDLGYLSLVVSVGSALARRFVDNANQLVQAQSELIQRERLAALGEMSAVVAHEVRNPVAVIFNAAATMRKNPDDREQLLGIVEEEAGRLTQMVTDLLDFARPTSVRLVEESLVPIIQSALDAVRQANIHMAIDVVVSLEDEVPVLLCDVQLLRQAIVNLVSNAIQSPNRKGPVRIAVGLASARRIRLAVIDDGAGVADDIADRIFRPFFTTRPTGTGLGLAVVLRIVQAHGGELVHRATPGGGATFELELPIRSAA